MVPIKGDDHYYNVLLLHTPYYGTPNTTVYSYHILIPHSHSTINHQPSATVTCSAERPTAPTDGILGPDG